MPRLIVREQGRERVIQLDLDSVTIGRSKANSVAINDAKASRTHCAIQRTERGWIVADMGSSNGTFLNGKQIQKSLLSLGDVISIGEARIHFERVIEEPAAQDKHKDSTYVAQVADSEEAPKAQPAPPPARPPEPAPAEAPDSLRTGAGGVRFVLRMLKGAKPGSTFPLGEQAFTIGRRASNILPVDDERVSGNHAQVTREGSIWILTDLESTNGTIVAGKRIKREILEHGTMFSVGGTTLQFVDMRGPDLAKIEVPEPAELSGPHDMPTDADFARIDVQKALKGGGSNAVLTFVYGVLAVLLIASVGYFSFQVFGQLLGRKGGPAPEGSLITDNWSFEDKPASAQGVLSGWKTPESGWEIDAKKAKTGNSSLRLNCSVNGEPDEMLTVELAEDQALKPDKKYQVKAQIMVGDARKAGVKVVWTDSLDHYYVQESYSKLLASGSGAWKVLRWTFVPPRRATRMRLSLCAFGNAGSAWFDDIELYEEELDTETRKSSTVSLGTEIGVTVDPRGTWSLARRGALSFWDTQLFVTGMDGKVSPFSRQGLSAITNEAAISANSMLYLGSIYDPRRSGWVNITQTVQPGEETISVRYKLAGSFDGRQRFGVAFSARRDILSLSPVEVSTKEGMQSCNSDFEIKEAIEMVWGSGENVIAFYFPEPVDISARRGEGGLQVVLSKALGPGKDVEFAVDFSETSIRQIDKIKWTFDQIESLRAEGKLQEARKKAENALLGDATRDEDKKRLEAAIKSIDQEADIFVKEARSIYQDFQKSRHRELLDSLAVYVERIAKAFPDSSKEREAVKLLKNARDTMGEAVAQEVDKKATEMLEEGEKYRQRGMYGLAAVYFEYVRDKFPGTRWEEDARAKLKQVEVESRGEGGW